MISLLALVESYNGGGGGISSLLILDVYGGGTCPKATSHLGPANREVNFFSKEENLLSRAVLHATVAVLYQHRK